MYYIPSQTDVACVCTCVCAHMCACVCVCKYFWNVLLWSFQIHDYFCYFYECEWTKDSTLTFHSDYKGKGISKTKSHQRIHIASKSSEFKCNNRLQEQFKGYQLPLRLHLLKKDIKGNQSSHHLMIYGFGFNTCNYSLALENEYRCMSSTKLKFLGTQNTWFSFADKFSKVL